MTIYCHIDGSAKPNPGRGGTGIVINSDKWNYTLSEPLPIKVTNNVAEYWALCRLLEELITNEVTGQEIMI